MRTRKFRVWNGTKLWKEEQSQRVKKGKKAYVERKVGECFQWKAHGHCSKGESCSFTHDRQAQRRRLVRWSETKRTIVFSRTKFEGQDWQRGRKTLKNIRQQSWKSVRKSVLQELAALSGVQGTLLQHSPVGESQENGRPQRPDRTLEELLRIYKFALESVIGQKMSV